MKLPLKFKIGELELLGTKLNKFSIPFRSANLLVLSSSNPSGWEQVSVSLKNRNPNWDEMCFVKDLFFDDEEICVQLHPKKSEYVNLHEHALHIWKPPAEIAKLFEIMA